jgi:hypothetical protein
MREFILIFCLLFAPHQSFSEISAATSICRLENDLGFYPESAKHHEHQVRENLLGVPVEQNCDACS